MNLLSLNLAETRWLTRVATGGWRKVRRSIKRRGILGTAGYMVCFVPAKVARKLGFASPLAGPSVASLFDRKYGVETAEHIPLNRLGIESQNVNEGNYYAPTSPKIFNEMMPHLNIRHEQFTFVDIGCGKGLVLLLASTYPFRRIIGVEFSAELSAIASNNLAAYVGEHSKSREVHCLCMDAVDYEFPLEPLVIYFYNPFKGTVLERVAANIARTIADHPRDLFVVYNNPTAPDVFDGIQSLERIFDDPDFLIYRTRLGARGRASSHGDKE
ncbi:MAG TPA: class I SAM-dependent methyltransferase [Nitrospira sp.]|nr:class I SAM-dependent methyltransferase [Nitrospira sp.]